MGRSVLHWVCVFALGVMPLAGCSETAGDGGTGGDGGGGGGSAVTCEVNVCPCTEAGILAAIAEGGGPFTFDCDGPQTVVTQAETVIDNDVILDGEGNLTVDGSHDEHVFSVAVGVTAELRRIAAAAGYGIDNSGTLTVTNSTVSASADGSTGIWNSGTLTVTNSTVSESLTGIWNSGTLTVTNSTVSPCIAVYFCGGTATIVSSTFRGAFLSSSKSPCGDARATFMSSVLGHVLGSSCSRGCDGGWSISNGYNIESDGDTCGFDQGTDQVNVSADDLKLGPLQDNGGPTETHALGEGSVAIDQIPAIDCEVDEDQRGVSRPQGDACDVGAFELEVAP